MADTGHSWSAWTFVQDDGGTDWDGDALADNAEEISAASISLSGKAACEIGGILVEDNTGAIDGIVTFYVLGSGGGIADEEIGIGSPQAIPWTPTQNDTVPFRFFVDPAQYGSFTVAVRNESGQELAISVKVRTSTIPVAS